VESQIDRKLEEGSDYMRMYMALVFCFAVLSVSVLNPSLGFAKTLYVNSSSSLSSALIQAQAGDEILVASGTYTGSFSIAKHSGTATRPITLRSEHSH
jgi:hypothetical protein